MDYQNEVGDVLGSLAMRALSENRVCNKPLIKLGHKPESQSVPASADSHRTSSIPSLDTSNYQDGHFFDRGDLLINGLYNKQTDCVISIRVTDTDSSNAR